MSRTLRIIHDDRESFFCRRCGSPVPPSIAGGRNRNHCPNCLSSLHLDIVAGDRRSPCKGLMRPIAVWAKPDGEWSVLHHCERCGIIRATRIAADDDEGALLKLALKPIARLPFPLET
ncbi:MAG: RNHCP domain-containing protein [Spirochaetae bacterium HGW-Spirochaetae-3]|jgi:hypothetical protein|nr:MAG: RNHCP domain-containing protein [Spirochaetae bacterium HGW-Spirochaetae-3]